MAQAASSPRQAAVGGIQLRSLAPLAVGLAAFGLGLVSLSGPRRSYDERVTIETASRSVGGIWRAARMTEAPHLLYYLLMKPWLALFGTSDEAARLPSVICGALAAMTLTALGARLFGRTAGLVAGATLATAAYVMQYSQMARGYAPALFLTVLSVYGFVRALDDPRPRWVVLWCVALVSACWMNLFAISVLAAQIAAYLARRSRPNLRLATAGLAASVVAVTPIVVLVGTADNGQLAWIPSPTLRRVAVESWDWSSRNPALLVAAAAGAAVLLAGSRGWARWKAALVIVWTVAPFVLLLVLSTVQPAFDSRYLLTGAAGLSLLVGAGVAALPRRPALVLAILVAAVAGLQLAHYYVAPGRPLSTLF